MGEGGTQVGQTEEPSVCTTTGAETVLIQSICGCQAGSIGL